jgi:integrase/recombinase XerD
MMKITSSLCGDRRVTLAIVTEHFLAELGLEGRSASTIQAHRNGLRQFGKFWGDRDLREATAADVAAYAAGIRSRVSRETAYLYLSSVRALFRHLTEKCVVLVDPSRDLPMPRMDRRPLGRVLAPAEIRRLLDAPDIRTNTGLRDRALLELLYSTGLRHSEVQGFQASDLGDGSLTVRQGKGAKDRVVPLGKTAADWVARWIERARPSQALFVNLHGRPFGKVHLRKLIHDLGVRAGISDLTCHAIRRTMATDLLRAGASPKEVSAILGHADLKSLSRYVRIAAQEVKDTHRKTHPREAK